MHNPKLLDLFCCEGGAAHGYAARGLEVHGVDQEAKKRRRYLLSGAASFTEGDAATFPLAGYDAYHGSPPCEDNSPTMGFGFADRGTGWLLPHTIQRLQAQDKPWIVENVESPANRVTMASAVMLCGSMFGLGAEDSFGNYRVLRRHRLFLSNLPIKAPGPCRCKGVLVGGVYGNGEQGKFGGRGYGFAADSARKAMGMPWATRHGCAEAIPPAMTEYLAGFIMDALR